MFGRRSQQGKGPHGAHHRGGASWLIYVSWFVMVGWALFMLYYWQSGNLEAVKENKTVQDIENALIGAEHAIEEELRHIRVAKVPITHVGGDGGGAKSVAQSTPRAQVTKWDKYELHVIFSTDCKPYQDWQSLVLFHSATVVGQDGPITRIASGCEPEKEKYLTQLYQKLYPQYYVHFTPNFKKDDKSGKSCKFYITSASHAFQVILCVLR
jgi:hypothetical protein